MTRRDLPCLDQSLDGDDARSGLAHAFGLRLLRWPGVMCDMLRAVESSNSGRRDRTVRWIDDGHFEIDGVRFACAAYHGSAADDGELLVIKSSTLVQRYLDLIEQEDPRVIVELGIKDGGSTAMLALAADPDVLVAIDLAEDQPTVLANLIASKGLQDRVTTVFGVDQADRSALCAAVDGARDGESLDLVVDDASHMLGPTVSSFETLFPLVRPGGAYIIEDWSADYNTARTLARSIDPAGSDFAPRLSRVRTLFSMLNSPTAVVPQAVVEHLSAAAAVQRSRGTGAGDLPTGPGPGQILATIASAAAEADLSDLEDAPASLVDLGVKLLLAATRADGVIASVTVDDHWLVVRRGSAPIDVGTFSLEHMAPDYLGYLS